jgi:hypothetical protein
MTGIGRHQRTDTSARWCALVVAVLLAASCAGSTVGTSAPTSTDPDGGIVPSTSSTRFDATTSTTAPKTTRATGPAAPVDVAPGTPGWFLTASDVGLHVLRPDGEEVPLVDGAVTKAVAGDATTIYFQSKDRADISVFDLRTRATTVAIAAGAHERLVLHGLAVGNRGPLPDERWIYYERIANGERRLARWQPATGATADLGVIASADDRVGAISYVRGQIEFLMIVEHDGRREFKGVGWDGEARPVKPCETGCRPWPCDLAVQRCDHLTRASDGSLVWLEANGDRQELVVASMSPAPTAPHREGVPAGVVVDEIVVDGSQIIVNTREQSGIGRALVFDTLSKGGQRLAVSARVAAADEETWTALPADSSRAYAFRRGTQLVLLDKTGNSRVLDDGPVRTVRAGPDRSVFFERPVPRGTAQRVEIWRVDVDTGVKTLVLPVPSDEFDSIELALVAPIEGRPRLLFTRAEWPPNERRTFENVQEVLYHTSLDGTDPPVRVKVVGGNEWGAYPSSVANDVFVGTRSDILAAGPAAYDVHGGPPPPALLAALRCSEVCDGSGGPSCGYANVVGCAFGFAISSDGTRLAWIETAQNSLHTGYGSIVGHDLVVVDAVTGVELRRAFVPLPTSSSSGSVTWLSSDRLLVDVHRSLQQPPRSVTTTVVAQLHADSIDFGHVVVSAADTGPLVALDR